MLLIEVFRFLVKPPKRLVMEVKEGTKGLPLVRPPMRLDMVGVDDGEEEEDASSPDDDDEEDDDEDDDGKNMFMSIADSFSLPAFLCLCCSFMVLSTTLVIAVMALIISSIIKICKVSDWVCVTN